jgi:hypothetical protein
MADLTKLPQAGKLCLPSGVTDHHGKDAFEVRFGTATLEATPTGSVKHTTNGDEERYADKSGTYTKCLKQKGYGVVDPNAFKLFRTALGTADGTTLGTADFEVAGLLGAGRKLNGPLGAFALTLDGADSQHFGTPLIPSAPKLASPEYAAELVELYWASLLRDVPFTDYETNATAIAAANELTQLAATYAGPTDNGKVTPRLLFRGGLTLPGKKGKEPTTYFAGENIGPYISQLCIRPTNLGVQTLDQKMQTYVPGIDYLVDLSAWQAVQNGVTPTTTNIPDEQRRYLHNGRGLLPTPTWMSYIRPISRHISCLTHSISRRTRPVPTIATKTSSPLVLLAGLTSSQPLVQLHEPQSMRFGTRNGSSICVIAPSPVAASCIS